MEIIFLLILSFLSYSSEYKDFIVIGSITKTEPFTTTSGSNGFCVYLDTYEFKSEPEYIDIYITVYNGAFKESALYYYQISSKPKYGDR